MTRILTKAMAQAAKLPPRVQDQLGEQLLAEIEGELKWDETLASSQTVLEKLAEKARRAKSSGRSRRGGFGGQ